MLETFLTSGTKANIFFLSCSLASDVHNIQHLLYPKSYKTFFYNEETLYRTNYLTVPEKIISLTIDQSFHVKQSTANNIIH